MDAAANATVEVGKCLWASLAEPISYMYNPTKNLKLLEVELQHLMSMSVDVKNEVEAEEVRQGGKRLDEVDWWLQKVQQLEADSRQLLQDGNSHQHNKCLVWCCPSNCLSSYKLGKEVAQLLNDVKMYQSKRGNFKALVTRLPPRVREMPMEDTVGLDSMLAQVWNWLHDKHVGIIGLWGMGGVGKTTLLKKINEKFCCTRGEFDVILWIVVSKQVDLGKIRESIRRDLGIEGATEIFGVLNTKKFVLLIDDIWERLDVDEIGIPSPNPTNGSKIVFTTRSKEVCGEMGAKRSLKVECLSFQQALKLFEEKVGQAIPNLHPDIQKYAEDIVQECKGLPLALIIIGRAMATKENPCEWEYALYVLKSHPSEFHLSELRGLEDVYKLLEFSYQSLKDSTYQQCFLYCALFPEDYNINKDRLIDLWIGEGFLPHKNDTYKARLKGECVIGGLKSACLLELGKHEEQVRMHDVIRDMALWIARKHGKEEYKVIVEEEEDVHICRWKEAERVSLQGCKIKIDHVIELSICSWLTTLWINETELETLPEGFFNSMPVLRVLDMSRNRRFKELPTGVGSLGNLQYLNLSGTDIRALPDEMKNLTSLQYLLLDDTLYYVKIPKEVISSLSSLKVFRKCQSFYYDHIDEDGLVKVLMGFDQLDELWLQVYTAFGVEKLLVSPNLQRSITKLRIWRFPNLPTINIQASSLGKLVRLNEVELYSCDFLEGIEIYGDGTRHMNLSRGSELTNLHTVGIRYCNKLRNLSWLIYAPNLQTLDVGICNSLVTMIGEDILQHIDESASARLFSSLTSLKLFGLPELMSIYSSTLSSPLKLAKLHTVDINSCNKLRNLSWLQYAPNLQTLAVYHCSSLVNIIDEDILQHVDENVSARHFSSLTSLTLCGLPELMSIYSRTLSSPSKLTNLHTVFVFDCHKLRNLSLLIYAPNLQRLDVRRCSSLVKIVDEDILQHIDESRLTNLHTVDVSDCHKLRNLSWLIYAPNLQTLEVSDCSSLVRIIDEDILQHIDENASAGLFSSLTSLTLSDLPELMSIYSRTLSSPSLREITVWYCLKLKKLPFDSNSGKNSLKKVRAVPSTWWSELEWDDEAVKAFFTSNVCFQ